MSAIEKDARTKEVSKINQTILCLNALLNEYQLAEILNCSVSSVRRMRLLNKGPRFRKIGNLVRYARSDIEAWLQSRPTGGGK